MSIRLIWEVRQRSLSDPLVSRELGFFTDDNLAEHAIQALYREAWTTVMAPDFIGSEWFPYSMRVVFGEQGWDIWYPNDKNSDLPTFYKVEHRLWNQVPSSVQNFTLTLDGVNPF